MATFAITMQRFVKTVPSYTTNALNNPSKSTYWESSGHSGLTRPESGPSAFHEEKDWGLAHRTLTPSFGPLGFNGMYDEMYDIATQLISKWARMAAESTINVTNDLTRLTLNSIALCALNKRLTSFYHEEMHPFVEAMTD